MTDSQKGAALVGGAAAVLILAALLLLPAAWDEDDAGEAPVRPLAGRAGAPDDPGDPRRADTGRLTPPSDDHMVLTIPALARVDAVPVPTAPGTAEGPLRDGAMHVEGTGYPWQTGANTYIAGHRLGFPGTRSHRLFWDLDELESGDRVMIEDSEGRRYEYAVFRRRVVGPQDISVTRPIPGKSVVTLQTCTLPDYAERLVVQAALVYGPQLAATRDVPAS